MDATCPGSSEAHDSEDFILVYLGLAALVEFQASLSTHIPYLRPALLDEVQELSLCLIKVLSWNLQQVPIFAHVQLWRNQSRDSFTFFLLLFLRGP